MNSRIGALCIVAAIMVASATWLAVGTASYMLRERSAARKRRAIAWWAVPKKTSKAALCAFLVLGALCDSLRAGQGVDPVIGFWRLNVEKSRSTGRIPWSETRRYQCDSAGIRLTETRVSADGHTSQIQYIVNYDGKEHAVFVANNGEKAPHQTSETMVFTRLDPYTVEGVSRVQGKLAYTFSRTVSADGRTLTIETVSAGMRTPLNISVLVYEKAVARMCTH